jgi:hypothetical protein
MDVSYILCVVSFFIDQTRLYSGPASSRQERRALRLSAVVQSIVKSSQVPISEADAEESISLLIELCPFFIKRLTVGREDWIEMPSPENPTIVDDDDEPVPKQTSSPRRVTIPSSPGTRARRQLDDTPIRSPKTVRKTTAGGLSLVRETIRRELDLDDQ